MAISPAWGQSVLNIVPGTMALGMMGSSIGTMKKMWDPKASHGKRTKHMLGGFTNIMIGTPLIGTTAGMISAL